MNPDDVWCSNCNRYHASATVCPNHPKQNWIGPEPQEAPQAVAGQGARPYEGDPATCECDYHKACRGEKSAPVQSAEELASELFEILYKKLHEAPRFPSRSAELEYTNIVRNVSITQWGRLIEADRAAQRQAGRNEAMRLERRGCAECEDGWFDEIIGDVGICRTCGGLVRIKALAKKRGGINIK